VEAANEAKTFRRFPLLQEHDRAGLYRRDPVLAKYLLAYLEPTQNADLQILRRKKEAPAAQ